VRPARTIALHCERAPGGPCSEGLDLVQCGLRPRYQPLCAAHAELLSRAVDAEGAARAYRQAIELSANAVGRAELERRLGALR
jgi:predicted RNA polymerase sigma factor